MKYLTIFFIVLVAPGAVFAQQYVIDPQHFAAVVENGVVRSSAESTHGQYLARINNSITDLNTNMGSVVLAQTMIYQALANVNSALKDGLEVKNMALIVADISSYADQVIVMGKSEPYLLLFAQRISAEMRSRALTLVSDVSGYVLKEGGNVLADYNSRDQLLRHITRELQIIDGLAYGAWKAVYWAKQRGIIASLDPFAGYISRDRAMVDRIIQNARYLRH